jgi:hypothetical protein
MRHGMEQGSVNMSGAGPERCDDGHAFGVRLRVGGLDSVRTLI